MTFYGAHGAYCAPYYYDPYRSSGFAESAKANITEREVAARGGADEQTFQLGQALNRAGDALGPYSPFRSLVEQVANAVFRAACPADGAGVSCAKVDELQHRIAFALESPRLPPEVKEMLANAQHVLGEYAAQGGEETAYGNPWASGSDWQGARGQPGFGGDPYYAPHYYPCAPDYPFEP